MKMLKLAYRCFVGRKAVTRLYFTLTDHEPLVLEPLSPSHTDLMHSFPGFNRPYLQERRFLPSH